MESETRRCFVKYWLSWGLVECDIENVSPRKKLVWDRVTEGWSVPAANPYHKDLVTGSFRNTSILRFLVVHFWRHLNSAIAKKKNNNNRVLNHFNFEISSNTKFNELTLSKVLWRHWQIQNGRTKCQHSDNVNPLIVTSLHVRENCCLRHINLAIINAKFKILTRCKYFV